MPEFRYRIADDVLKMFAGYRLGVLVFSGLNNGDRPAGIDVLLRSAEESARAKVRGNVSEEAVVAAWRDAYRSFGAKPSEHRSSVEALLRRVLKPDRLPSINPLVDIGNIVSLRHMLPAGVHPIRHETSMIELRFARSGDRFCAASDQPAEQVTPGEVVLADAFEVLTRRWTWRQCVNTRMHASTERAFFNIDALAASTDNDFDSAMREATQLVAQFCGGTLIQSIVLDAANPEFVCTPD